MKEKLETIFDEMSTDELLSVHREYCNETNSFDDEIFSMDELDEVCSGHDAYWIACRVAFGEFNAFHDYFTFNGYGNIKTLSEYEIKDYIDIDEIIDYIIDNEDALYNDDIQAVLDECADEDTVE